MTRRCLAVLWMLAAACAPHSGVPRAVIPSSREITDVELSRVRAEDLLSAIQLLRPYWVPRRGAETVDVYLGSSLLPGGMMELRAMRPDEVQSVEYLTLVEAQFRFPDARRAALVLRPARR